jgi:hypothetical protein
MFIERGKFRVCGLLRYKFHKGKAASQKRRGRSDSCEIGLVPMMQIGGRRERRKVGRGPFFLSKKN